ncbi:MAG: flagellar motor switch protein FliG [Myxococcota bacterium]
MSELATVKKKDEPYRVDSLSGEEKALLFLVSLDERVATAVMAHLERKELSRIRKASEKLTEVTAPTITAVHREFVSRIKEGVPASLKGSGAYLRRLTGKALGEGRAAEVWDDRKTPEGPVAQLSNLDIPTIMALLEKEKPQTLAVVLSLFEPGRAAELLAEMDSEKQAEVVLRMARLQAIPESVIEQIEEQFAAEIAALGDDKRRNVKGIEAAAAVVKRMESDVSEELMEELASIDEAIAEDLKKSLFTFEDLIRVDGKGMQQLLKEVSTDQLVVAMKNASEDIKEKILGNVSSRAAALLREELELMGPVRVSEVEEAQQAICAVAAGLAQDGRIVIASEGGGDYV